MTFTWDFNTATLMAIFLQAILLVVFLVKTANTAKIAMQRADDAHTKIAALSAQHTMHREMVAREYVDKEDLKEIRDAINGLRVRIDEVLGHWRGDRS